MWDFLKITPIAPVETIDSNSEGTVVSFFSSAVSWLDENVAFGKQPVDIEMQNLSIAQNDLSFEKQLLDDPPKSQVYDHPSNIDTTIPCSTNDFRDKMQKFTSFFHDEMPPETIEINNGEVYYDPSIDLGCPSDIYVHCRTKSCEVRPLSFYDRENDVVFVLDKSYRDNVYFKKKYYDIDINRPHRNIFSVGFDDELAKVPFPEGYVDPSSIQGQINNVFSNFMSFHNNNVNNSNSFFSDVKQNIDNKVSSIRKIKQKDFEKVINSATASLSLAGSELDHAYKVSCDIVKETKIHDKVGNLFDFALKYPNEMEKIDLGRDFIKEHGTNGFVQTSEYDWLNYYDVKKFKKYVHPSLTKQIVNNKEKILTESELELLAEMEEPEDYKEAIKNSRKVESIDESSDEIEQRKLDSCGKEIPNDDECDDEDISSNTEDGDYEFVVDEEFIDDDDVDNLMIINPPIIDAKGVVVQRPYMTDLKNNLPMEYYDNNKMNHSVSAVGEIGSFEYLDLAYHRTPLDKRWRGNYDINFLKRVFRGEIFKTRVTYIKTVPSSNIFADVRGDLNCVGKVKHWFAAYDQYKIEEYRVVLKENSKINTLLNQTIMNVMLLQEYIYSLGRFYDVVCDESILNVPQELLKNVVTSKTLNTTLQPSVVRQNLTIAVNNNTTVNVNRNALANNVFLYNDTIDFAMHMYWRKLFHDSLILKDESHFQS
jgi:hypothetical protein